MKKREAGVRGNQRHQQRLAGQLLLLLQEICKQRSEACGVQVAVPPLCPCLADGACPALSGSTTQALVLQGLGHGRGGALLEQVSLITLGFHPSLVTNWPCLGGCGERKLLPGLQSPPCPLCVLTCTPWTPLMGGQLFLP